MSTKLFDGYLYDGDLDGLMSSVSFDAMRKKANDELSRIRAKAVARSCARAIVQAFSDPDFKAKGKGLTEYFSEEAKAAFYDSVGLGKRTDFDFENTIFLKPHPSLPRKTLVYLAFDNTELRKLVSSELSLGDYHYQNCEDRPSEVSELQWSAREEAWAKAISGIGFRDSGFLTFDLHSDNTLANLIDLLVHAEAPEIWSEACKKALRTQAQELACEEYLQTPVNGVAPKPTPSSCIRFIESEVDSGWPRTEEKLKGLVEKVSLPVVSDLLTHTLGITRPTRSPSLG